MNIEPFLDLCFALAAGLLVGVRREQAVLTDGASRDPFFLGVILTSMLSLKQPLHAFVAKVSADDIFATLKFLILAVIILPLLPNQNMGPLNVLNPFKIGLMIVLMAGLGFVGYVLIRALGAGR